MIQICISKIFLKLDLDKIKKSSNNSNYTNPNLDGIIKNNIINTPFYSPSSQVSHIPPTYHSTSSQFPQQIPNFPTNPDMGFFPPNMYDPQINMIMKPFVLNQEKWRQDFNSPKYENRRKEFFVTLSEFLRSYIRDKYYKFMNDIQTEVNFFAWFDHYFKPVETKTPIILSHKKKSCIPAKKLTPIMLSYKKTYKKKS